MGRVTHNGMSDISKEFDDENGLSDACDIDSDEELKQENESDSVQVWLTSELFSSNFGRATYNGVSDISKKFDDENGLSDACNFGSDGEFKKKRTDIESFNVWLASGVLPIMVLVLIVLFQPSDQESISLLCDFFRKPELLMIFVVMACSALFYNITTKRNFSIVGFVWFMVVTMLSLAAYLGSRVGDGDPNSIVIINVFKLAIVGLFGVATFNVNEWFLGEKVKGRK